MRHLEGRKEYETEEGSKEDGLLTRGVGWELDAFINHESPQPGVFLGDLSNACIDLLDGIKR